LENFIDITARCYLFIEIITAESIQSEIGILKISFPYQQGLIRFNMNIYIDGPDVFSVFQFVTVCTL